MQARSAEELVLFERQVVPLVERLRSARTGDAAEGTSDVVDALCDRIGRLRVIMPETQVRATVADLRAWAGSGFADRPQFDRTRDAVPAPDDGTPAAFVGPVLLPNSDRSGPFLEAFSVVREETEHLPELQATYPHPKAVFQSTRLLSASSGLRDGNCVVFFPENIPAATRCTSQNFAWFFFNRHVDIYVHTLDLVRGLCGDGSPFDGETGLRSAGLDAEDVYQARCVWGYMHDYFHHTGPRPLDQHLALKTKWRPGLLEELKVDLKSAVACHTEPVPFGDVVFEYIVLERLFRYPAQPFPRRNFDSGTGFALGTWLAGRELFTVDAGGRRRLGPKASIVDTARELVATIEDIERHDDDEEYRARAEEFLFGTLLRRPEREGDRYDGPLAPAGLWGDTVDV